MFTYVPHLTSWLDSAGKNHSDDKIRCTEASSMMMLMRNEKILTPCC